MNRIGFAFLVLMIAPAARPIASPVTYRLPEETAQFRAGAGVESATANCLACHSADYVNTQASKKGEVFWEAEVQKMVKVFHAPIEPADAKTIADYLAATY